MPGRINETNGTELNSLADLALVLGEIRGQLRELVHGTANVSMKLDALAIRVAQLENEQAQRKGATDLLGLILKSPALGWLVTAIMAGWALLTGKIHT